MAYATVDELAAALRIRVTAENTATLQACLDAAALEIDHAMDRRPATAVRSAPWTFDAATAAADPGAGNLRLDRTNPPAAQALYLSLTDANGAVYPAGDFRVGDRIRLAGVVSGQWDDFAVTAAGVDHTTWAEIPVDHVGQSLGVAVLPLLDDGEALNVSAVRPSPLLTQELALANRVNVLRGLEWWKANDAAFGLIGITEAGALQAPRDTFARHARALVPLKQLQGIA